MGTKISALPSGTIAATDSIPVVKSGVTTKVAASFVTDIATNTSNIATNTASIAANTASIATNSSNIASLQSSRTADEAAITVLQGQTMALPALVALDQSGWTWFNQSTATVNQSGNIVTMLGPASATGTNLRGRLRGSYPSTPFTLNVAVRAWCQVAGSITNLSFIGFTITDGTKHKFFVASNFAFASATGPSTVFVGKYPSATSASGATATSIDVQVQNIIVYLRLVDNGSTHTFSYSLDGQTFVQVLQETRTTHLTPSDIGIVFTNQSGTQQAGGSILSWSIA